MVQTEKELGEALKKEQDTIEIEGGLSKRVLRIKAPGTIAWAVAIGAIGIVVAFLITSGGIGIPLSGLVGLGAVPVLGKSATVSAVSIALAAGGVNALNSLRCYRVVERDGNYLVLRRK